MSSPAISPGPRLPLADYLSTTSFLAFLLISNILFLPRSSSYLFQHAPPPAQKSSADRPEHPFLTPLTSSPLGTMVWWIIGDGIVMAWWGTRLRGYWYPSTAPSNGDGLVGKEDMVERSRKVAGPAIRMVRAGVMSILASVITLPLLMALGAPLDEFILHTYLLALHLSLLLVWPVIYTLGIPSMDDTGLFARYRLIKLLCEFHADSPLERTITYPFCGTLVGAWLGAFVIPLDWDRPWQSWPLTPAVDSTLGFVTGNFVAWAQSAYTSLAKDVAAIQAEEPPSKASAKKAKKKVKAQ